MSQRTIDQLRAADSYQKIMERKKQDEKKQDSYADYTIRLPVEILTNGLGQALAQLLAASKGKQDDPHYQLYQDLQDWLLKNEPLKSLAKGKIDLLDVLVQVNRNAYQWAISEAISWLEWHKKLATAYLKKPEANENE